ncbi:MAG: LuxR C-terminal-related transcriptional regulator [Mycobacterium sp.]
MREAQSEMSNPWARPFLSLDRRPLRGRGAELAAAGAQMDGLDAGVSAIIVIQGPAGGGKSRMLQEYTALARDRHLKVLSGSGDPDNRTVVLAPLLAAFTDGPAPLLNREAVAALGALAGEPFWILQALQQTLEQAALVQPLLITVDDLQWCDELTLLALRTLPGRLSSHAITWVIAMRDDVADPSVHATVATLVDDGGVLAVLRPLSRAAVVALTSDVLDAEPDDGLQALALRTQGNPMMLRELLLGAVEDGSIRIHSGHAELRDAELPMRFREAVRLRIDRLSRPARAVLQAASVLGRRFSTSDLAAVMGTSEEALISPLREAVQIRALVSYDPQIGFQHDLMREAIESGIPPAMHRSLRRRALDVQIQRGVNVTEIASALADLAEPGDLQAVVLLRRAAAELTNTSPTAAAALLTRVLELLAIEDPNRPVVAADAIAMYWRDGQPGRARALADDALSGTLPPEAQAQVRLGLAMVAGQHSFSEAIRHCEAGLALHPVTERVRAQLYAVLSTNLGFTGDLTALQGTVTDGLTSAKRAEEPPSTVLLTQMDSFVKCARLQWHQGLDIIDGAIELNATIAYQERLWAPQLWRSYVLLAVGRVADALTDVDVGRREAIAHGHAALIRMTTMMRSRVLMEAGRFDDALAEAESALEMGQELGSQNFAVITALTTLGRIAIHTGDPAGLARAATTAQSMIDDDTPLVVRTGHWHHALLAESVADTARAAFHMALALDGDRSTEALFTTSADEPIFVRILLAGGDRNLAVLIAETARRRALENPHIALFSAGAAHTQALLTGDIDAMVHAADLMAECQRPMQHANTLHDCGLMLRHRDQARAIEYLQDAEALYSAAGATRDLGRTRQMLRAAGVSTSRPTPTGKRWLGLTPTEAAVVRLIASGSTNGDVAAAMFLSPHTVSTHLRHVFIKFGITSRVELARIVAAADPE